MTALDHDTKGLSSNEAEELLSVYGPNRIASDSKNVFLSKLIDIFKNPLAVLLFCLAIITYFLGDVTSTLVMFFLLTIGSGLQFFREVKAENSVRKLKLMVSTTATVIREGVRKEILLEEIVPGDIIHLASGDMVPADVRLISSKDLFVNQSVLTGESLPVEKNIEEGEWDVPFENPNLCFMGSNVESGTSIAFVLATGNKTYLGQMGSKILKTKVETSFDKGVNQYTKLMIGIIFVMAPLVFCINGISKGEWFDSFLFAIAVAVGLAPEMLPMLISVNLSKGAMVLARKKVIVKRLNAMQNFGAVDVLCTDKTGTITLGKIILEKYINMNGDDSERVLKYSFLNSFHQTGLRNLMDVAILKHVDKNDDFKDIGSKYRKIDEIPFDFIRRRMSVVVENKRREHLLICKGAVEEILNLSTHYETNDGTELLSESKFNDALSMVQKYNAEGFRVIAVAYKIFDQSRNEYMVGDEEELILLGFLAFLDPPKESSAEAIRKLYKHNVDVKVLTGDNDIVTQRICHMVNLPVSNVLLGAEIDAMSEDELNNAVEHSSVFAKLSPIHKERIIKSLQFNGHVVGFLGDGINDTPALKAADVGISVDTAVDIAKESSDIILLENNLLVLEEGIIEGRRVFGNIIKYIKMTASSNFGNIFSVLASSIFIPFLPMLSVQILANNLLYDFSQLAIPHDNVDEEWLAYPRKWQVGEIKKYIFCIGPISSIFDCITFFVLWYLFKSWSNPALFQTGWFLESIFTQTFVVHIIRTNKIPFVKSRASIYLFMTTILVSMLGVLLVNNNFFRSLLGFTTLPTDYYYYLFAIVVSYLLLTQLVKTWLIRKFHII